MRCPFCAIDDDRVVDSRLVEEGSAIRRRRECGTCNHRYTTYERIEESNLYVVKRSGDRELFSREKILQGVRSAVKNRGVEDDQIEAIVATVEDSMRLLGRDVTTEEIGVSTLEALKIVDSVAYVRFASVYKGFENVDDFAREVGMLVKTTAPKSRS